MPNQAKHCFVFLVAGTVAYSATLMKSSTSAKKTSLTNLNTSTALLRMSFIP